MTAEFESGIAAKATGGTVIPVTVSGGTVGETRQAFTAMKVTVKIGGLAAQTTWVDATTLKVVAPSTTKATSATMIIYVNGVPGPESSATVGYVPGVSGVLPTRISTAGGTTITIAGVGFLGVDATDASAVTVGGTPATSVTVVSATKITAVAPAGTNGSADVVVSSAGGGSPVITASKTTYRAALTIDTTGGELVAKASGGPLVLTVLGGSIGTDVKTFTAERISVAMGSKTLAAVFVDETHLKVTMPASTAETADLAIVHDTVAGESTPVTLAPVVTSLSVKTDTIAGGKTTVVKAAGADLANATDFKFGENAATCTTLGSGTALTFSCTVPPATAAGPVWVSFTAGSGRASRFTAASTFAYTDN
ncbi:hypothetical protein Acsp01_22090 [Actinoplanes sp. NBRC 101535]|nr:hypothetical protein Acsp01_22090 [Actinoplanes sp. NBRC 101535]